jgi:pantothenate synthetase
VAGGIIPTADAEKLREAGVAAVFTPKDYELTPEDRRGGRTRRLTPQLLMRDANLTRAPRERSALVSQQIVQPR